MRVDIIPARADNYVYLIVCGNEIAAVDPGDAAPVAAALRRLDRPLGMILITHNHADHVAGCEALYRDHHCRIVAPSGTGLPPVDRIVADGDAVAIGGHALTVLATPGHADEHIALYDAGAGVLFSGDTLFVGGCGRLFGTPAALLWQSLLKLRALPDETRVFVGHEYTVNNLEFAAELLPDDAAIGERLRDVRATVARGEPTVPTTLGVEKRTNVFLRADDPAVARAVGLPDGAPADVFAAVRRRKDRW